MSIETSILARETDTARPVGDSERTRERVDTVVNA